MEKPSKSGKGLEKLGLVWVSWGLVLVGFFKGYVLFLFCEPAKLPNSR